MRNKEEQESVADEGGDEEEKEKEECDVEQGRIGQLVASLILLAIITMIRTRSVDNRC